MIKLDIMKGMFLAVLHRFVILLWPQKQFVCEKLTYLINLLKMNNYALCDHSLKVLVFVRYNQEFS